MQPDPLPWVGYLESVVIWVSHNGRSKQKFTHGPMSTSRLRLRLKDDLTQSICSTAAHSERVVTRASIGLHNGMLCQPDERPTIEFAFQRVSAAPAPAGTRHLPPRSPASAACFACFDRAALE